MLYLNMPSIAYARVIIKWGNCIYGHYGGDSMYKID